MPILLAAITAFALLWARFDTGMGQVFSWAALGLVPAVSAWIMFGARDARR